MNVNVILFFFCLDPICFTCVGAISPPQLFSSNPPSGMAGKFWQWPKPKWICFDMVKGTLNTLKIIKIPYCKQTKSSRSNQILRQHETHLLDQSTMREVPLWAALGTISWLLPNAPSSERRSRSAGSQLSSHCSAGINMVNQGIELEHI